MGSKSGGSSMQQPMPGQSGGPNPQAMNAYTQSMPQFQPYPTPQQGTFNGPGYTQLAGPFQTAQQYSNYFPMNMQFLNAARQNGYTNPTYNPYDMAGLNAARTANSAPPPPPPQPAPVSYVPPPPMPPAPNPQAVAAYESENRPRRNEDLDASQTPVDPRSLDAMRGGNGMSGMPGLFQGPARPISPEMIQTLNNIFPRYYAKGGSVDDVGMALSLADRLFNERHYRD